MRKLLLASVLLTAGFASAQSCGTLAVSGGTAGTNLDVSLTGATPDSFALIFVAQNQGSTALNLGPLLNLTIDLAGPVIPLPFQQTDASGDAAVSIPIPAALTQQIALHGQAATLTISLRPLAISGCTSNVAAFSVGG